MGEGLLYCGGQWSNSFCISKLIESISSGILIVFILWQVFADIKHQGQFVFGFIQTVQALMFFTLIYNLIYSIDHSLDILFYLESLFYDWYFCTLVFYVTFKILAKSSETKKRQVRILIATYLGLILAFATIFIFSVLNKIEQCQQIWFLAIDGVGLLICLGLVIAGRRHHANQIRKLIDFTNQNQIKNPLTRMWLLIIINLFCQVLQLIESLVFMIQADLNCHFSTKTNVDRIIKLIFSLFSLHLSFACTIVVFELKRRGQRKYQKRLNRLYSVSSRNSHPAEMLEMKTISLTTSYANKNQNQI